MGTLKADFKYYYNTVYRLIKDLYFLVVGSISGKNGFRVPNPFRLFQFKCTLIYFSRNQYKKNETVPKSLLSAIFCIECSNCLKKILKVIQARS